MLGQFRCQYADCRRTYKRKEHLVRHEKSHGHLRSFRCHRCGADFHRGDLLNRHIRLSSKCKEAANEARRLNSSGAAANQQANSDPLQLVPAVDSSVTGISGLRNAIYEGLGLGPGIASREELERAYFRDFHPHWPLLDDDTFKKAPQLPDLITAVLIAGLWMVPTRAARKEAITLHDTLMQKVIKTSLNEQPQWTDPSPVCLPYFQALLIPLILFVYRPLDGHFPDALMCSRRLSGIFNRAGVYQQGRIDEHSPHPAIRQQYQRLALLHYKLFVHNNTLVRSRFPRFQQFDYLQPNILQVRVPVVGTEHRRSDLDTGLVSDLLGRDCIDKFSQLTIAALTSWDFSLGMIFACIITQKDEDSKSLLQRIEPNLFLYLAGWEVDPGD
ncbi:hypothetical protein F4821DRAFT_238524 [Hypoxylon rubiginosum]|uniref:Uncharacterized protein n=1 Tax=Hypoxylon rubiginosum TaxID=110542 RepID=A0ACC0D0X5_9PEZI|nr:hypothetical protein F4821DRAFT_238524 [Hypoxylon rubiginosum]